MKTPLTIILASSIFVLTGCEYGPRHLPKHQYDEGLQAFTLIQKAETVKSGNESQALENKALHHIDNTDAGSEMERDLLRFETAVDTARLTRSTVGMIDYGEEHGLPQNDSDVSRQRDEADQAEVMLTVCRDNAARWFKVGIPFHPECTQRIFYKRGSAK